MPGLRPHLEANFRIDIVAEALDTERFAEHRAFKSTGGDDFVLFFRTTDRDDILFAFHKEIPEGRRIFRKK